MKVVVIAGIPGSGSTTVLSKVLEELDYLRKLSPDIQKEVQKNAAQSIRDKSEQSNIIVDTHCTINTPSGFLPGLPKWVLDQLKPDMFILLEADGDEILKRRISDTTRNRDSERLKDIELHQEMNRAASMAYAVLTGATVKIIENHDNKVDEAVDEMVKTLK
jgi:adenylate kinase